MPGTPAPEVATCTIAASNYLARVRVLARSLHNHGAQHPLAVFLIDDPEGRTPDDHEPFRVLSLDDLPLNRRTFGEMALCYSLTELATAVKPQVVASLLDPGPNHPAATTDVAVYLDPDTEVFANLDDLWQRCTQTQALLLTPHALKPYPRDGLDIDERMLLLSGTFNLGFIAVPNAPWTPDFVHWWGERLRTDALIDPGNGLFTDQRWIDLAPTLFPCDIVTDPGMNVAYWNLHERPLTQVGDGWHAGGAPLRMFHYSGFDPRHPHLVSTHQRHNPRVVRSDNPALGELLDRYASLVASEHATEQATAPAAATTPGYRWDVLPSGIRMTNLLRQIYRSELLESERGTNSHHPRPPAVGDPGWVAAFSDWLCEPVPPRSLPRVIETLLVHRPDVETAFMHGEPHVTARYLGQWLATWGVEGHGLTMSLAQRLRVTLDRWADACTSDRQRPGPTHNHIDFHQAGGAVDLLGFTSAVSGLSTAVVQVACGLGAAEVDHRTVAVEHPDPQLRDGRSHDVTLFGDNPSHNPAGLTITCFNPDLVEAIGPLGRQQLLGDGYRIGYWWWEVNAMPPQMLAAFNRVDEIWAGSTFCAELFADLHDTPVFRVPLPLRKPAPVPLDTEHLGIGDHDHLFSFVFDHSSTLGRKNPDGLIEAYCEAFGPRDGATLVIKSLNARNHDADTELVRHLCSLRPDIHLIEQRLRADQLDGLVAASSALVSLHRSEGLGLTIADACHLGVPVIATAYGGCMDFLAPDSSLLVPATMSPVGPHNHPYPADATWAEPDLGVAVAHLRHVADNPGAARAMAGVAQTRITDTYDAGMCADIISDRLRQITGRIDTSPMPTESGAAPTGVR